MTSGINGQLLIPDQKWSAVSNLPHPSYPATNLYDGYVNRFYHTLFERTPYQWISVNLGIEINVGICCCIKKYIVAKLISISGHSQDNHVQEDWVSLQDTEA